MAGGGRGSGASTRTSCSTSDRRRDRSWTLLGVEAVAFLVGMSGAFAMGTFLSRRDRIGVRTASRVSEAECRWRDWELGKLRSRSKLSVRVKTLRAREVVPQHTIVVGAAVVKWAGRSVRWCLLGRAEKTRRRLLGRVRGGSKFAGARGRSWGGSAYRCYGRVGRCAFAEVQLGVQLVRGARTVGERGKLFLVKFPEAGFFRNSTNKGGH